MTPKFFLFNYSHWLIVASENLCSQRHNKNKYNLYQIDLKFVAVKKLRLCIKESSFVENRNSGNFDRRMTLICISKRRFFSFFVISEMVLLLTAEDKVSSGIAFYCCRKQLPLVTPHPIFLQHMICSCKRTSVTAIRLLIHWQKSGCDFPKFTN